MMAPPPGYVPYGGQSFGAFGPFQSVLGIGRTLGILLMIVIPVQVVSTLVSLSLRGKAQDLINERISQDDFNSSLATTGVVSLLSGALTISIATLTIIWMFRMAKNQRQLGRQGTWGPGWAIGGWFVPPCVLYVVPYLMFRDLWKSSDPDSAHDWRTNKVGTVVHVWWVLFGLAPLASLTVTFSRFRLSNRTSIQAARDLDNGFVTTLVSNATQIAAAVAFLLLVRQLTARHARTTHEAG